MEKKKVQEKVNNKKQVNIFIVVLILFIAIYAVYSIINLIVTPADTFLVKNGTLSLEESCVGYIIREEKKIQGENYKNGIVQIKMEGEKVAKNETVFRYYSKNEESLMKKISELDSKIDEALSKETDWTLSDIKSLESQIEEKIDGIKTYNDVQKIKEIKKDINSYTTKKAEIAGKSTASGSYIRNLIDERSKYEEQLNSGAEELKSPIAGIVSYRIDNLEEVLTVDDFSKYSKKLLEDLNLRTGQIVATNNEAGKVINNFKCYIATVLKSKNANEAEVGDKIKIRLYNKSEISATVEYISKESDEEVLIILKITNNVEDLILYRKMSFDIIWWSKDGLKVPNSAIVYEGDLAYVVRNRAGYLDKILVKVLKENETYSIVDKYKTEELKELGYTASEIRNIKGISLYDEIMLHPRLEKVQ